MEIVHQIIAFADAHGLTSIFALVAAHLALGVAVAIKQGEFQLTRVGDIFTKVGPLVIGYVVCDLLIRQSELTAGVLAVIVAQLSGDILKNLAELYPALGARLPTALLAPSQDA